ncbi:MAG: procyclic acidic repetitive family protein [Candidatus Latescibacteria bacterium]|nr:procyclic acidic repetitive family protein [Candidatus Latescibacterota bacterium]
MHVFKTIKVMFIMYVLFVPAHLYAQDPFEDLVREQDQKFQQLKKEADEELERLKAVDKEFAEILNRAWKELDLNTGKKPYTEPKPENVPIARPSDIPEKKPDPKIEPKPEKEKLPEPEKRPDATPKKSEAPEQVVPEKPEQIARPEKPPVTEPEKTTRPESIPTADVPKIIDFGGREGEPLSLSFFGTPIRIRYDKRLNVRLHGTVSESTISTFWETIGKYDYENFLMQMLQVRKELELNDWGYCLLLTGAAEQLYLQPGNDQVLFIWFMLVKSGFDAHTGFDDNRIVLLLPSKHTVYNTPFYELGGKTYYITFLGTVNSEVHSLYTYEGNHKEAVQLIDYTVYRSPGLQKQIEPRNFTFSFHGTEFSVPVQYNINVVDYFDSYPQINLDVYFKASLAPETETSLLDGLKPIIDGKSEGEAVNILLRFVQTAFNYRTDDEQFGVEKPLFPEETVFYPYSDCEDRSFLFAYLTTHLLGLEVIGLHYPGHLATAVKFTSNVEGDSVLYNNTRYIICDPTFINADYGECMPQFKSVDPEVIQTKN